MKEKAWMQKTDELGVSLYGHITEVLATILTQKPADGLDALEAVSAQVKGTYFKPGVPAPPPGTIADAPGSTTWQAGSTALLKAPGKDEEVEEADAEMKIPDLMDDMKAFAWAGVGLSAAESYRVYVSLDKLQRSKKLQSVRFFGKVLGTGADYYVAEATYMEPPEEEEPEEGAPAPPVPLEAAGVGCNACVYFVTNDPSLEWTVLPNVTPAQVSASVLIRKYMTGSLTADVRAYPPFPGKEKEYLRAQIARIVHATTLCPKDKYILEGDVAEDGSYRDTTVGPADTEAEGYVALTGSAMADPSNWCAYYAGILAIGRTTNMPVEEEEGDEEEAKPAKPAPEPEAKPLTPITPSEWSVQMVSQMGGADVVVARSFRWPGAYSASVLKEDKMANLYIGYGHEYLKEPFAPQVPAPIMQEPDDLEEQKDEPLSEENAKFKAAELAKFEEEIPDEEEAEE